MGGHGSGSYCRLSNTITVEKVKCIDIRFMRNKGMLRPGSGGLLTWSFRGEQTDSANYRSYSDRVELNYRCSNGVELVAVVIWLCFTPCNVGGNRAWFCCPGCQRRCEVLCLVGKWPACRKCYRLPYQSQNENQLGRLRRRRKKLEAMLWGESRKWWRKAKREQLLQELELVSIAADRAFVLAAANFLRDRG